MLKICDLPLVLPGDGHSTPVRLNKNRVSTRPGSAVTIEDSQYAKQPISTPKLKEPEEIPSPPEKAIDYVQFNR